jgi:hypothetical protein
MDRKTRRRGAACLICTAPGLHVAAVALQRTAQQGPILAPNLYAMKSSPCKPGQLSRPGCLYKPDRLAEGLDKTVHVVCYLLPTN